MRRTAQGQWNRSRPGQTNQPQDAGYAGACHDPVAAESDKGDHQHQYRQPEGENDSADSALHVHNLLMYGLYSS